MLCVSIALPSVQGLHLVSAHLHVCLQQRDVNCFLHDSMDSMCIDGHPVIK